MLIIFSIHGIRTFNTWKDEKKGMKGGRKGGRKERDRVTHGALKERRLVTSTIPSWFSLPHLVSSKTYFVLILLSSRVAFHKWMHM